MPDYLIQLKTDATVAVTRVEAESVEVALVKAFAIDLDTLHFEPYTTLPVNEITVTDPAGEAWVWRDDDLMMRRAADALLVAAKDLLIVLKSDLLRKGTDRVTLASLRSLKAAIDLAEGRSA